MDLNTIVKYIENKNWTLQKEGERYLFYKPPTELGFAESYTLPIPKNESSPDYQVVLQDTINLIAEIYNVNVAQLNSNLTDYFEILKKDAIYFKLSSENVMFQQTLEVNDVWTFLKNLSTSYTNYIKIEFEKTFGASFGGDNDKIKKTLSKLIELSRLRVVALEYKSFSVGVSADSFMGKTEIGKDVQDWRDEVIKNYKNDVIDINFDSKDDLDKILGKFSEEERKKIYDPLISSINNTSEYSISVTDQKFTPKRKMKRIPTPIVDLVIPKEITKEIPKKKIGFYKTIITVDESKQAIKLKLSDLEDDTLFTQRFDEIDLEIKTLIYQEKEVKLNKTINFSVLHNSETNSFEAHIPIVNINFTMKDLANLQQEFNNNFTLMIDYYKRIQGDTDTRSKEIIDYLKDILPTEILNS
jgi:hypothetical protein